MKYHKENALETPSGLKVQAMEDGGKVQRDGKHKGRIQRDGRKQKVPHR